MNAAASGIFAEGFFNGYLDVISAMLSVTPSADYSSPNDVDAQGISAHVENYGLKMQADVSDGGSIIFLANIADCRGIVGGVMGETPSDSPALADDEIPTMKEIFDPCMGSGVSHFKEAYGYVIELSPTDISMVSGDNVQAMCDALGAGVTAVAITYSVPELFENAAGVLLFSQSLENAIPEDAAKDIAGNGSGPAAQPAPDMPQNIDLILDINLDVTARLGRVEMPLGQILELGPGSIIDVGHSVDDPVELLVNNKLIARGDVVVVEEKFGLRISEIVTPAERIESLR